MRDVDAIMRPERAGRPSLPVRALFSLRFALGRALRWDTPERSAGAASDLHRLTDEDRARSIVPPGTASSIFKLLYVFADETAAETRNATVHAFLVRALRPRAGGYRLYWGIYVKPVGRLTPLYMAVIEPFRRFIVYPALIRQIKAAWARAYA